MTLENESPVPWKRAGHGEGASRELFPAFLKLKGRKVLVVGGGNVAAAKVDALASVKADVHVVAPEISFARAGVTFARRAFAAADLDGAWFVVAAATREVNRAVAAEAEARRIFVNAVDDPSNASAYLGGVVRRGGVTVAVSTDGVAPALAALLREGLEAVLPDNLEAWVALAREHRAKWRAAGVPIELRRGLLLAALVAKYSLGETSRATPPRPGPLPSRGVGGLVSLVGAGPGDPGLLAQRAAQRLREADLVLHDALVSPELLKLAGGAQRFPVGKRAGRPSMEQGTIEKLMIRAARRGKRVVRLKAGDPFVLGRGGEEALALREAGIDFEVVPGITSAIAAPAAIGIPVTHRGLASSFVVLSGHAESEVLGSLAPGAATLVILMGVGRRLALQQQLERRGWAAGTPAALVAWASTPRQWSWVGTLAELPEVEVPADAPAVIIIGEVVSAASQSGAFATRRAATQEEQAEGARHVHG